MLNEVQASLLPYLGLVGENPWLQAVVVVFASLLPAWIFDRFISAALRKMAMERNQRIGEVARSVLSMLEVIG